MMRTLAVVVVLFLLSSSARADERTVWRGVFVGSIATTALGLGFGLHGREIREDARQKVCDGGGYAGIDPSCSQQQTLTQAQLDALNAQGDRGHQWGLAGLGIMGVGLIVGGISFYKGFIKAAPDSDRSQMAIAPTISRTGAGASFQLRF